MTELIDLPDLGVKAAEKLATSGIHSLDDLRVKGADLRGQSTIATGSVLNMSKVRDWVRIADLLRVAGMDVDLAQAVSRTELSTTQVLARANLEVVQRLLEAYQHKHPKELSSVPAREHLQSLIDQAKALPAAVTLPETFAVAGVSLSDAIIAGQYLACEHRWRTLRDLGDRLLYDAIWELGTLVDEEPPVPPAPRVPPDEALQMSLADIQAVLETMSTSELFQFSPEFGQVITPELVQANLAAPPETRAPFAKQNVATLPKLATGSDYLSKALFNLHLADLDDHPPATPARLAEAVGKIWRLEATITHDAVVIQRALASGDLESLERWLVDIRWYHRATLYELARLQAQLTLIADPLQDFQIARWFATLESLRRSFVVNRVFAAHLLAQIRAKMPLDATRAQATDLPFIQRVYPDVSVAQLVQGSVGDHPVRLVGRKLPASAEDRAANVVTLRDFTDKTMRLRVALPAALYFQSFVSGATTYAVIVSPAGAASGQVMAQSFDLAQPPNDWQSYLAQQVAPVFSLWPGGVNGVLFPILPESRFSAGEISA